MIDIKQLYKTKELATFTHFSDGDFWYKLDHGFAFPVPLADLGNSKILAKEQASLLWRYINKHQNMLLEVPL